MISEDQYLLEFRRELQMLRDTRERLLHAHDNVIAIAGSGDALGGDGVDVLCTSLTNARALTEELQEQRLPALDQAWSTAKATLTRAIPEDLAAAAKRPWLALPQQLEQLLTERQEALAGLATAWNRSMDLAIRESVGMPCRALIKAMVQLGRTESSDQPALYAELSIASLIQMTLHQNEMWAVAWSGRVDACRLGEFTVPSAALLVDRFRQTRIQIAEATAHARKIQVAVGSEALIADASLQLQSLEFELSEALKVLASTTPDDRLRVLTELRAVDLCDTLDSQADEWLDNWLAEVNERKRRGLAAEAAAALRETLYARARLAADLSSYARALRESAMPAGTYAVSEGGIPLVNTPRPPKWIELHPFGWNQPLPPFPSDWHELSRRWNES